MKQSNNIPQAVIDELQPQEGFSYIKHLGTLDNTDYYCLSYKEDVEVGFPTVIACKDNVIVMVYGEFEALRVISSFIK